MNVDSSRFLTSTSDKVFIMQKSKHCKQALCQQQISLMSEWGQLSYFPLDHLAFQQHQ
jgi:hypothetical protein